MKSVTGLRYNTVQFVFWSCVCMRGWNIKTNLAHVLDLRVLCVEVLLKLGQLIQVPSFFTETFARIPKLHL